MNHLLLFFIMMMGVQSNNSRILAVYTNDAHNPRYIEQLKLLQQDQAGLKERNLVIMKYILDNTTAVRFKDKDIEGNFTLILTGKDGGEKFRSLIPVTTKKLYSIIDAMPMRMEEMKAKRN